MHSDHTAASRSLIRPNGSRLAAVGVGVVAQFAQPQHRAARDPGLKPFCQLSGCQRVLKLPVGKPGGNPFTG
jgi:hypothetical protein